jgi:hypothetical protein
MSGENERKIRVGFDLDGTLDRPELTKLANMYYDAGFEVHVITVSQLAQAGYITTRAEKMKKLSKLGVKYTKLHLVRGATYTECGMAKADVINAEGIVLMFDDAPTFVKMMVKFTKSCTVLEVQPLDSTR